MTIRSKNIIVYGFAFCMALLPVISLLWQESIFLDLRANWLIYPLFLLCVGASIFLSGKVTLQFITLTFLIAYYLILVLVRKGEVDTLFRFFICVLPFTFFTFFYERRIEVKWFWIFYSLSFSIPLYLGYLQYTGQMAHMEFDTIDGQDVGRITGGYNKPMNLIAFVFPLYILGFYFAMIRRQRMLGYGLIFAVLVLIYVIGHRTSLFSFAVIFGAHFFARSSSWIVKMYYRYYMNLFAGIVAFVLLYFYKVNFGFYEGLRGRIPMWLAHSEEFFNSGVGGVLFGQQKIMLDPNRYSVTPLIASLQEVHNNSFRTIVFFGIAGFAVYSIFVRSLALSAYSKAEDYKWRFLRMACFIFLILFSLTNEPFYYASLLWPILFCVLPVFPPNNKLHAS